MAERCRPVAPSTRQCPAGSPFCMSPSYRISFVMPSASRHPVCCPIFAFWTCLHRRQDPMLDDDDSDQGCFAASSVQSGPVPASRPFAARGRAGLHEHQPQSCAGASEYCSTFCHHSCRARGTWEPTRRTPETSGSSFSSKLVMRSFMQAVTRHLLPWVDMVCLPEQSTKLHDM